MKNKQIEYVGIAEAAQLLEIPYGEFSLALRDGTIVPCAFFKTVGVNSYRMSLFDPERLIRMKALFHSTDFNHP